jgi:hypothetical protein
MMKILTADELVAWDAKFLRWYYTHIVRADLQKELAP